LLKEQDIKLTKFELEIMDVLWKLDKASIREIYEQLPRKNQLAYTTIQTIVNRLEEKGAVSRIKKIGNAHIFQANIKQQFTQNRLIEELIESLGGTIEPLILYLIESKKISLSDIKEMERVLIKLGSENKIMQKNINENIDQNVDEELERNQKLDLTQD
jgi:predicted transcriptional regulator